MIECNDFTNKMASKLKDTTSKKDFKVKISRMKKKLCYILFI